MLHIAICDDEASCIERLNVAIARYFAQNTDFKYTLHTFLSGTALLQGMKEHGLFDIVFLDIIMQGYNGIQTAQKIRAFDTVCSIVFLTSYTDYAVSSYQVKASNYILKPFTYQNISQTFDGLTPQIIRERGASLVVKTKYGVSAYPYKNILYIESNNHIVTVFLQSGAQAVSYTTLSKIGEILNDPRFVQCHKSYLVNLQYVRKLEDGKFFLPGSQHVPISKTFAASANQAYLDYLFGINGG